ncbi:MAG: ankyrin repeat domain-containing protein [Alphaproteobacteria bacterium]|nr:ankyrin repeat domain-containing protein [Alphaproteobacteria bacterium]
MPESYDRYTPPVAANVNNQTDGFAGDQSGGEFDGQVGDAGLRKDSGATSYWIQARAGDHWRNLESLSDPQDAVSRIGDLVADGAYDELKLVEARLSPTTGRTDYNPLICIEGYAVVESGVGPIAQQLLDTVRYSASRRDADSYLDLDPWRRNETAERGASTKRAADQVAKERQPADLETPGVMAPMLREAFDRLSAEHPEIRDLLAAPRNARSEDDASPHTSTANPDHEADSSASAPFLKRDAEPRTDGGGNGADSQAADRLTMLDRSTGASNAALIPKSRPQNAALRPPQGARTERVWPGRRRGVWLGGVLAGAFIVGLGIAALNPDAAIRFYAAVTAGDGGDADRRATIDYPVFPSVASVPTDPQDASTGRTPAGAEHSENGGLAALIERRDLAGLRAALEAGADANGRTADGEPLLLAAARGGGPSLVDALLLHGADPMQAVGSGETVLHAAAAEGLTDPTRLMLAAGAPVDAPGGPYGCLTPLGAAASHGQSGTAKILTDAGARVAALPGCDADPRALAAAYPSLAAYLTNAGQRVQTLETAPLVPPMVSALEEGAVIALAANLSSPPAPASTPAEDRTAYPRPPAPTAPTKIALRSDTTGGLPGSQTAGLETGARLIDPETIQEALADLIESGGADEVSALLRRVAPDVDLSALTVAADDRWGRGPRPPVDHAVLSGKLDHAAAMISAGVPPSDDLLHIIAEEPSNARLLSALPLVLQGDVDVNSRRDGETPLMTAARAGSETAVAALLANGADPTQRSADGRTAVAFARESGVTGVRERIAIAAVGPAYEPLMFGLTWRDTLDTAKPKTEVCRDVIDGFVACKLNAESWLEDTAAVVAQFDMRSGGRLVAIQLDSRLFANELEARQRFDDVVAIIDNALPSRQTGFPVRETALEQPFFEGLKPSVGSSDYDHYWPDQDGALPVYIHLKMIGHAAREGFYRVLIGNPFRVG